jgi:nucleotide-binding universal stress UspA family protein
MKNIKNILVPTDFSDTARNAYHYAKRLAITLGAAVTVVNVNEYFIPVSDIIIGSITEDEVEDMSQEAMEAFITDEDTSDNWAMSKHKVKTQILRGSVVNALEELSSTEGVDLIVLGMTGKHDYNKIIGSTALELANKAHCPVILVPHEAKWHRIEKIMYASSYQTVSPMMIKEMSDFAVSVKAAAHFVHIVDTPAGENKNIENIIWNQLHPIDNPHLTFRVHTIYAPDKIEELKKYTENNTINLISFVSKHRGFWHKLIHKNITENIAISADIPVMVMHLDDGNNN